MDSPLPALPAEGATIISLTDGSEYEGVFETALTEAGSTLGWTVESVTVDAADPVAVATAFDEAVAAKPAGIHIQGQHVDSLRRQPPGGRDRRHPGRVHRVLGRARGRDHRHQHQRHRAEPHLG